MDRDFLIVSLVAMLGIAIGAARVWWWMRERSHIRAAMAEPVLSGHVLALLQAMPGIVIVVDSTDTVVRADVSALAMGLVRERVIASVELREALAHFRATGEGSVVDVAASSPSGGPERMLNLRIDGVQLAEDYTVLIARDHTPMRRLNDTRKQFIADISHELKTPIGAISLLAETIRDSADDAEAVRHFAASLCTESERLSRLVADIIELSRVEARAPLLRARPCAIGDIVTAGIARESLPAATRGMTIHTHGVEEARATVLAVRDQLERPSPTS
ncbi:hypothetical protein H8R18_07010 [Nanchangia anserum]|uniref:sensor histidine kinase n=1 Tax=Nanchangia anserum TaxID=2692125 RepID=UPI00188465DF|nr:histidine kinase dimerization/phospho-acceptor domain-containing protein [Nanchangia anserum]QOX81499.1 hypothetical protein H8R18_07010 [Nanchangia anserum]